ncbi:MAG: tetratricopeptide repeat protein [Candidatus Abyssobacteria bacterium SURF_5]|uniref:Tetratricopeptide repeat protein n=1 Tax=Abyssobacteria bacterium (strain SURF_5) TaxID=2093360 RepID=A0A3A4NZW1_ABYX5|nr:MAG: tetratricopeptide repeat protein [Candidatus Abyssubacteria bacterium SURF_5]
MNVLNNLLSKIHSLRASRGTATSPDAARQHTVDALNQSIFLFDTEDYDGSLSKFWKAETSAREGKVEELWTDSEVRRIASRHVNNLACVLTDFNHDDKALELLQWQMKTYPNDYDLHYNLARLRMRRDEFDHATAYYKKALECALQNQDVEPQRLGLCISCLGAAYYKLGDSRKAVAVVEEAMRTFDLPSDVCEILEATIRGFADETMTVISRGGGKNPAREKMVLANQLDVNGQFFEACSFYEQALRISPNDPEIHFNYGVACQNQADPVQWDKAISLYQNAIRINPEYAEAHTNIGIVYGRKGDFEEAIGHFEKAVNIGPETFNCRYFLGKCCMETEQYEKAIESLDLACAFEPDESIRYQIHKDMEIAYMRLQKSGCAAAHLEEAVRIGGRIGQCDGDDHARLAQAFHEMGLLDEAKGEAGYALSQNLASEPPLKLIKVVISTSADCPESRNEVSQYEETRAKIGSEPYIAPFQPGGEQSKAEGGPAEKLGLRVVTPKTIDNLCQGMAAAMGKTLRNSGAMSIKGSTVSLSFWCDDGKSYEGVISEGRGRIFTAAGQLVHELKTS